MYSTPYTGPCSDSTAPGGGPVRGRSYSIPVGTVLELRECSGHGRVQRWRARSFRPHGHQRSLARSVNGVHSPLAHTHTHSPLAHTLSLSLSRDGVRPVIMYNVRMYVYVHTYACMCMSARARLYVSARGTLVAYSILSRPSVCRGGSIPRAANRRGGRRPGAPREKLSASHLRRCTTAAGRRTRPRASSGRQAAAAAAAATCGVVGAAWILSSVRRVVPRGLRGGRLVAGASIRALSEDNSTVPSGRAGYP